MEVSQKIFEYIDALAQKLGVASEYVFSVLVNQKISEGIIFSLVLVTISLLLGISTFKVVKYVSKNYKTLYKNDTEIGWVVLTIILAFASIFLIIADILILPEMLLQIFNPEYYAFKEIMKMFK